MHRSVYLLALGSQACSGGKSGILKDASCPQGDNWDPNSMRGLLGSQMGSMLHPQLSGSNTALSGLAAGLQGAGMARNPSDAASNPNLGLHTLRSKSPWEGATGAALPSQGAVALALHASYTVYYLTSVRAVE